MPPTQTRQARPPARTNVAWSWPLLVERALGIEKEGGDFDPNALITQRLDGVRGSRSRGPVSRSFLEQAQRLGGEMARALAAMTKTVDPSTISRARLDDAFDRLWAASTPLLHVLNFEEFIAPDADESQS